MKQQSFRKKQKMDDDIGLFRDFSKIIIISTKQTNVHKDFAKKDTFHWTNYFLKQNLKSNRFFLLNEWFFRTDFWDNDSFLLKEQFDWTNNFIEQSFTEKTNKMNGK